MKIEKHKPLGDERYIATFGRSEEPDIDRNSLLTVTDTETGNYTCLDRLAGTFYEREILEALGRTKYGEEMPEPEPVDDRYHSEEELEIIAGGLESGGDGLLEQYGIEEAVEELEEGHPENNSGMADGEKARRRLNHEDYM